MDGIFGIVGNGSKKRMREEDAAVDTGSADGLLRLATAYFEKNLFSPGDLVEWKDGLKIARWPAYSRPAVVLDVKPGQVNPSADSNTAAFQDPCDIRVGMLDRDGDFVAWWMDSARFKKYTPPCTTDTCPIDGSCEPEVVAMPDLSA